MVSSARHAIVCILLVIGVTAGQATQKVASGSISGTVTIIRSSLWWETEVTCLPLP